MQTLEFKHFHFCCGLGGGAKGFNQAKPIVGNLQAKWRCLGGIDIDPQALRDFEKLAGVKGTLLDLFTREQYIRFHGTEPAHGWTEATPEDIRKAAQNQDPDTVFISSPCKGASGLLSETKSKSPKYQALNELTLRCIWLMCEAWQHNPVPLIVFENVPRLATRGRHLLDQINQLLKSYGYAVAETTHDCGELGGLAQSRKRFLLVARHIEKVPPFLYEPAKKTLKTVGDILSRMPLPNDIERAGPMHRVPNLQWKTWVRLALIEAGKDWRSLNQLKVQHGLLKDYLIVPDYHNGYLGVRDWHKPTGTIAAHSTPSNGNYSIADPRIQGDRHKNVFKVVRFWQHSGTVTGGGHPTSGGQSVADPRNPTEGFGKYFITPWHKTSKTVIAGSTTGQSAFSLQDPRLQMKRANNNYLTGGHYGVLAWDRYCHAISASACHDNGQWSVADPRLPNDNEKLACVIQSLDGTWHRPFTTFELAALQSLVDPEEQLILDGLSDSAWRERIGNAVPPRAAQAIAEVMGTTLLLAASGETFVLSNTPIWVRPIAVALSLNSQILEGV